MRADAAKDPELTELAEAFDLLGDETRCAIVLALSGLSTHQWSYDSVRFSRLKDAVDVADGGRFNYHLQKLCGTLVEQDGDRYTLTADGARIAEILRTSLSTAETPVSGNTGSCPTCDRSAETTFDEGFVAVECPEHGRLFDMVLPPAVADNHDVDAIETLAGRRAQWYVELAMEGACLECWGAVERRVPVPLSETSLDPDGTSGDEPVVEFECSRCQTTYWLPPAVCVLRHPAVIAFYHEEHDRNVLDGTYYDLDVYDWSYPGIEETADGLAVTFVGESGNLRTELDESATVIDTERTAAGRAELRK